VPSAMRRTARKDNEKGPDARCVRPLVFAQVEQPYFVT
jgi:hypothetical protein